MIAYVASYYGISPLEVERWKTSQIYEWHNEASKLESLKAKAFKEGLDKNG